MMGDEICLKTGSEINFEFEVHCDGWFDKAEVYKNNEVAERYFDEQNQIRHFRGSFNDTVRVGTTFYYVKIYQTDGGLAWSSPIFIEGE